VTVRARAVEVLYELETVDADVGAVFVELHLLLKEVRVLRGDLLAIQSFKSSLPIERQRLRRAVAKALQDGATAEAAFVRAQDAVRSAGDEEKRAAELFEIRARDRLSVAERGAAKAEIEVERMEKAARDAEANTRKLDAKARSLAGALRDRPRVAAAAGVEPGPDLEDVLEWTETAQAALLVARSQVGIEQDAVIRQANELGSVVLNEMLSTASVAVVARRVEQALLK
jgi:hypothetical protein